MLFIVIHRAATLFFGEQQIICKLTSMISKEVQRAATWTLIHRIGQSLKLSLLEGFWLEREMVSRFHISYCYQQQILKTVNCFLPYKTTHLVTPIIKVLQLF